MDPQSGSAVKVLLDDFLATFVFFESRGLVVGSLPYAVNPPLTLLLTFALLLS